MLFIPVYVLPTSVLSCGKFKSWGGGGGGDKPANQHCPRSEGQSHAVRHFWLATFWCRSQCCPCPCTVCYRQWLSTVWSKAGRSPTAEFQMWGSWATWRTLCCTWRVLNSVCIGCTEGCTMSRSATSKQANPLFSCSFLLLLPVLLLLLLLLLLPAFSSLLFFFFFPAFFFFFFFPAFPSFSFVSLSSFLFSFSFFCSLFSIKFNKSLQRVLSCLPAVDYLHSALSLAAEH